MKCEKYVSTLSLVIAGAWLKPRPGGGAISQNRRHFERLSFSYFVIHLLWLSRAELNVNYPSDCQAERYESEAQGTSCDVIIQRLYVVNAITIENKDMKHRNSKHQSCDTHVV